MEIHPDLMNISLFNISDITKNESVALKLLEEVEIIPSKESTPPMCCELRMKVERQSSKKFGWVWRCSKAHKVCRKIVNPAEGTFFDGKSSRISVADILSIIICFVMELDEAFALKHLKQFHRYCGKATDLSHTTINDYYKYCREVAEVMAAQTEASKAGPGKIVHIDETSLKKRKYGRERVTKKMIELNEDKTGLATYKRYFWKDIDTDGERIQLFLEHLGCVYCGYRDGILQEGLFLEVLEDTTEGDPLHEQPMLENEIEEVYAEDKEELWC